MKRGLLLYGPPGNGKALTVRYIVSQTRDHTVLVLTGGALGLIRPACALARMLEPALVVLGTSISWRKSVECTATTAIRPFSTS